MNAKAIFTLALPCLLLASFASWAGETDGQDVSGEITLKVYAFDFSDGPGGGLTHFLERYSPQQAWSGSRDSGSYGDVDLFLSVSDGDRDFLTLERRGFGLNNHRTHLRANTAHLRLTSYYSNYRSGSGGVDYLFNPNRVPGGTDLDYFFPAETNTNSGYLAQFNDDTDGRGTFKSDRTTFGVGMNLRPVLFGGRAWVSLNYDGYRRSGNKFGTYILGGGDVREAATNDQVPGRVLQRWRGFEQDVEENMNRLALNLTAAPGATVQLSYDGALEKFDNRAKSFTHADIVFPAGWQYNAGGDSTRPLGFTPDSTLMTHAIRLSKTFGGTSIATGYGLSRLEQDSFTQPQESLGFSTGRITTGSAYLNLNHRVTQNVRLEGHVKYLTRDNDSSFPVPGLLDPADGQELGVRIDSLESMNYGMAATFRARPFKSTITAGWRRKDIDRDLTFADVPGSTAGIIPSVSLYEARSASDELYLTWAARPTKGVTVRVTPSFLWADKTGLVTEPEKSSNLRATVGYAAAHGMHYSGYYNYRNRQNSNNTFTDKAGPLATYNQDIDNTYHAAGAHLNLQPSTKLVVGLGLDWSQNDFEAVYFSTDRRRFETTPIFLIRDTSAYDVDTHSMPLNLAYQANDRVALNGSYTFTKSKGDIASGLIATELADTVDGRVNNSLQSLTLGVDYEPKNRMTVRLGYAFDDYDDNVYTALSGGVHTFLVGLSLGF